jgi:drug/metabolite transporter (DMT)-like permease
MHTLSRRDPAERTSSSLLIAGMVTAVIAISFAAIFFRKTQPTHPLVAAGLRLAIAAVLLSPWVIRARLTGALGPRVIRLGSLAGLFYGVHFGAWVTSLTLTSVVSSVTLVTATPLLLGIAALVTGRDRPTRRHWVAIAGACAGLALISQHDLAMSDGALLGDALALLGAAAMAGYLLVGRRLGDALEPLPFTGVAVMVGAILLLGSAWLMGVPIEPASNEALIYIVLAALIPQLVGHTLLTWAVRRARPMVVGMATVGEPVGAACLAAIWPGIMESVSPAVALGCGVTLASVLLALWRPSEASDR